jgi:hypothetical protein
MTTIPNLHYFYRDQFKRSVDAEIKTSGKRIGYIVGAGDKVPDALTAMGYQVEFLNEEDIDAESLQRFDAVVIGYVRTTSMNT